MAYKEQSTNQPGYDEFGWPSPDYRTESELILMYGAMVESRRIEERATLEPANWPKVI